MKLRLIQTRPEVPNVETFIFEPDERVEWQPGQYMHYVFTHPDEDDRGHERWFTIAAAPFEKHLQITTRFNDEHSSSFKTALKAMKVGDTIEADGPKGKFVISEPAKKHVFLAGGIGITPYRGMLAQMDHDGQDWRVELLYANRDEDFVFGEELERIASRHQNFRIHKFIGGRHIEEADLKPYADDPEAVIYLSGPEPMIESFEETLKEKLKVAGERVKTDFFPGYPAEL
jgi:ferredoxin-NADP reductase